MQHFWVWNNGTNKDRSGRLIWFDSSMAFCWYLNFFAPTWNVNSTVFSTEMQFSPSWFWLIKPDSWMFWCKSVIRGLWEGFEMKAKHLCSCSLCSCVPTGSSFFFFIAKVNLCTEVQHQTLMNLSLKNWLSCCLYLFLCLIAAYFSLSAEMSQSLFILPWLKTIQDPQFKSQAGPKHSPHFWEWGRFCTCLDWKNTCHVWGKHPSTVKTRQLKQGWCCDI